MKSPIFTFIQRKSNPRIGLALAVLKFKREFTKTDLGKGINTLVLCLSKTLNK